MPTALVNKTGITRLGTRLQDDINVVSPTLNVNNRIRSSSSENTGTSQDPYLDVEYEPVTTTFIPRIMMS